MISTNQTCNAGLHAVNVHVAENTDVYRISTPSILAKSPWITYEFVRKMRKSDFLKMKAEQSKDQSYWAAFTAARNEVNNSIKYAKRKYFEDNLAANRNDPRKTWQLINELSSHQHQKKLNYY